MGRTGEHCVDGINAVSRHGPPGKCLEVRSGKAQTVPTPGASDHLSRQTRIATEHRSRTPNLTLLQESADAAAGDYPISSRYGIEHPNLKAKFSAE
jgi:hypothetical protein